MGTFAALALATPLFGFALTPPSLSAGIDVAIGPELATAAVQVSASDPGGQGEGAASGDSYVAQVRERARFAKLHRTLGIITWAGMTMAVGMGTVQFRNLYGAWDDLEDTPCVTGDAWPKQSRCSGTPLPHLLSGVLTAGLYTTTMTLSFMMPDPDHAAEGPSQFSKRLRAHKILRWIHLAGMVAQMVLGPLVANPHLIGQDRVNDYGTLRALASVHLAVGYVTWGSLTTAGALMLF